MSSLRGIFESFRDVKALSFVIMTGKEQKGQKSEENHSSRQSLKKGVELPYLAVLIVICLRGSGIFSLDLKNLPLHLPVHIGMVHHHTHLCNVYRFPGGETKGGEKKPQKELDIQMAPSIPYIEHLPSCNDLTTVVCRNIPYFWSVLPSMHPAFHVTSHY